MLGMQNVSVQQGKLITHKQGIKVWSSPVGPQHLVHKG